MISHSLLRKQLLSVLAVSCVLSVSAETLTWKIDNPSGAAWNDAANWLIGSEPANRIPAAGDDVVFPDRTKAVLDVVISSSTPELGSVTVNTGWRLALSGWETCLRADQVTVQGTSGYVDYAARISPAARFLDTEMSNRVWIVARNLTVTANGRIDATGRGYYSWSGPGWTGFDPEDENTKKRLNTYAYAGGAYGGQSSCIGDATTYLAFPNAYGSISWPTDPGCGTGHSNNISGGGGAILLEVSECVHVDGRIEADGDKNQYWYGGGSGGGIAISCRTIEGTGTVSASAVMNNAAKCMGSTGSGGRIAVRYNPTAQAAISCSVAFRATGGASLPRESKYARADIPGDTVMSDCGTLWFPDQQLFSRQPLGLSGALYYGSEATEVSELTFENGLSLGYDRLEMRADNARITVCGDLTVAGNRPRCYGVSFIGQGGTLTVSGSASLQGGMIHVRNGGTVSIAGDLTLCDGQINPTTGSSPYGESTCGQLVVTAAPTNGTGRAYGAEVTVGGAFTLLGDSIFFSACDPTDGAIVKLTAKTLDLGVRAQLNAIDAGFSWNVGPGRSNYSGSAHGGAGGANQRGLAKNGNVYGLATEALTPGSGGGTATWGHSGGGVIALETHGDMLLDGTVIATGHPSAIYSAGTSGGSVNLKCGGRLSGNPRVIAADGGACCPEKTDTSAGNNYGSGGGGGRIAIFYRTTDVDLNAWNVHASGGRKADQDADIYGWWGEDGSVYFKQLPSLGLLLIYR